MTQDIIQHTFNFEGTDIRTIAQDNEVRWVLSDVCKACGIGNPSDVMRRLDDDQKGVDTIETLGGPQKINVVNESGLYDVILDSRKPEAKRFRKWVTGEVLPSIRKHGAYMTEQVIERTLTDPDYLIQLATTLKEERAKRIEAEQTIKAQQPKVLFADAVSASHTDILIGDLAKILRGNDINVGQKRLFTWMREKGYLIKASRSDYNMPSQRAMELGLFRIKETAITHADGHVTISKTVKVTPKGQQYFINKFLNGAEQ